MSRINTKYLRELALGATQGTWIHVGEWVENVDDDKKDICNCSPNGNEEYKDVRADAVYISAIQPSSMLEILDELDRLYSIEESNKQTESSAKRHYKPNQKLPDTLLAPSLNDRIMNIGEVELAIGRKRSWIYEAVKTSEFPAPVEKGRGAWWLSDINSYLESLKRRQRGAA